jgi:hypothetical protein
MNAPLNTGSALAHRKTVEDIVTARNRARQKQERSRFFPGIADAMAEQWGGWVVEQKEIRSA